VRFTNSFEWFPGFLVGHRYPH